MMNRVRMISAFRPALLSAAAAAMVLTAFPGGCTLRPAEPGDQPWSTRDLSRPDRAGNEAVAVVRTDLRREEPVVAARTSAPPMHSPALAPMTKQPAAMPVPQRSATGRPSASARDTQSVMVDASKLRINAIDLLRRAAESSNDQLRVHAVEAMQFAPEELEDVLRSALGDANRGVRFGAAMMVGKLRLSSLAYLAEPLVDDPSESVRAAAIFALHRANRSVSLDPLAAMLRSPDPEVKGNAVMVLGELANPTAMPMLREAARNHSRRMSSNRQRVIDLQIAEAMVRMGDEDQLDVIRAALFAPADQGEFAAMACMIAGRLRDEAYGAALHDMAIREGRDARPAEVRLAAALALAEMTPERAPVQVPLAFHRHENFQIRAQAAWTLGAFTHAPVRDTLAELMQDENPLVQVSAAGGMLRWLQQNPPE